MASKGDSGKAPGIWPWRGHVPWFVSGSCKRQSPKQEMGGKRRYQWRPAWASSCTALSMASLDWWLHFLLCKQKALMEASSFFW